VPAREHREADVTVHGIEARGLWLARGERQVLRDVSLSVPAGVVTALLGPSGAGKSTLLRCLNRLVAPDRGEVLLDGGDICELAPRELGGPGVLGAVQQRMVGALVEVIMG
jgi:ABC-type cobalamin/Fe3+-siderophores transport system ATPase subunit